MKICCIGAGTIGLSWVRLFATHGHDVHVTDPRPDLEDAIDSLGLDHDARTRIRTAPRDEALVGVDLVQESGPERVAFKRDVVDEFDRWAPRHALLLSSSSALRSTDFTTHTDDGIAARVAIGHPFNPPHLTPLVEVVPGRRTSPETVRAAVDFYAGMGKQPITLAKEVPGHVGNRLQKALLDEALGLVLDGVITVPDLDTLMKASLGIRWAAIGPLESMAIGGGAGGMQGFVELLRESFATIEPHHPAWDHDVLGEVYRQADDAYGVPVDIERLRRRDRVQQGVLEARGAVDREADRGTDRT